MNNYTVIGYFENDDEVFVNHVSAETAAHAEDSVVSGYLQDGEEDLVIVAVLDGLYNMAMGCPAVLRFYTDAGDAPTDRNFNEI